MKTLHISDTLKLPVNWALQATVVYGARGSGKTVFNAVFAEESNKAGVRFCAIDLKGDLYGLKSSADGKRAALPVVVFGGDHADVPLEPDAGAFIGETVAGLEQSCILDLEHLSKGKQIRFLAAFFAALYDHNRAPIVLLLDECQRYAPQKPLDPDAAKCLGAVEDLVKLGRKHGIGTVLTTQRGSGLNKEVSELCELLVAFRTPGPLDQERIKGWLDANTTRAERETVMSQLSGLPTGTAVFASGHPDLKVFGVHRVRMRETFDSSATPKIGERRLEPKALAQADLTVLRERMAAAIERAKAEDPKALRAELAARSKRVAELERDLARAQETAAQRAAKPAKPPKEVPVIRDADLAALERQAEKASALLERVGELAKGIGESVEKLAAAVKLARTPAPSAPNRPFAVIGQSRSKLPVPVFVPGTPAPPVIAIPLDVARLRRGVAGGLPAGELAVMKAVLMYRETGVTPESISVLTGYTRSSRNTYLQRLRQAGNIDRRGDRYFPTDAGVEAVPDFEPLPKGEELRDWWLQRLPEGEATTLRMLIQHHPTTIERPMLQDATGYTRSSSNTYVQRLRAKHLVVTSSDGVKASDNLFEAAS